MTKREYLLICLMEELSEMQQEASKCLRFTAEHTAPIYDKSNLGKLIMEYSDVCALLSLLREEGLPILPEYSRVEYKRKRTLDFLQVSRHLGVRVDEEENSNN